jgi:hypothetical protein
MFMPPPNSYVDIIQCKERGIFGWGLGHEGDFLMGGISDHTIRRDTNALPPHFTPFGKHRFIFSFVMRGPFKVVIFAMSSHLSF